MHTRSLRSALALLIALLAIPALALQPGLVQPESLEQGFVLVVTDRTGHATTESPILLASNHNGWNPNDPTQALTRRSDGKWQIVRKKPELDSRLNFKFTRGSWDTVEVDTALQEIENRLLPQIDPASIKPGEAPIIELVIENWKDQRPPEPDLNRSEPYRTLEVNGDVRRLEVVLLGRARDLLVWVPAGFDEPANATVTYPIVWMLDGQAAFENVPALGGEWDADTIAADLVDTHKITPPIIVAVPGPITPEARVLEYGVDQSGPALLADLNANALPRLVRACRADPSHAMIVGVGVAGKLASFASKEHLETFGVAFTPTGMSRSESEGVPFDATWSAQLRTALLKHLGSGPAKGTRPSGIGQPRVMKEPEFLPTGFMLVVTDKSGKASDARPMHIGSNHNGWNPGDPARRLTPRSDSKWQIELPPSPDGSRIAFKLTLGSWDTVEVTADMNDIANRELPLIDAASLRPGEKPVIEITVDQFRDPQPDQDVRLSVDPYREIHVAGGTLKRVEVAGGPIPIRRDILVWLPPGYDDPNNASRRYPILYLHDGQNVFEKLPHVPGEWMSDEAATRLIAEGKIEPLIIVGVPSAGARRIEEYVPVVTYDDIPARAPEHVRWLTDEVIPRVERVVRARTDRESRLVGGSSLGAVVSLYAATERPDLFGATILESPAMLAKDRLLFRYFEGRSNFPQRAFIGVGTHEVGRDPSDSERNAAYLQSAKDLYALFGTKGIPEGDRTLVIGQNAIHNEDAWAERFPAALEFLFPPMLTGN
jgi:predicted alpha/beta superfamily hydrolase